jgi:VanZ family protein
MLKKYILSIVVALIIMYLSLASSDTFDKFPTFNIPNFDKLVHFCMYFGLMSVILFDSRKSLKNTRGLFLTALIPLGYGILMEILQSTLTTSRTGSFYDITFNFSGILVSMLLWLKISSFIKDKFK